MSDLTKEAYERAAQEFRSWRAGDATAGQQCDDLALARYMNVLYFQGHNPSKGRYLLHGFVFCCTGWPNNRQGQLPNAARALKGWERLVPAVCRDPTPWGVVCLVAVVLVDRGLVLFAAALLLQFDTYGRPSEILNLRGVDLIEPDSFATGAFGDHFAIVIAAADSGRRTKTGHVDNTVLVGDRIRVFMREVVWLLKRCTARPDDLVFPFSLPEYEAEVRKAAEHLGLGHLRVTPHTMRHGGPSHDAWVRVRDLKEIQARGHWESFNSVRRYEKHAKLLRVLQRVPAELRKKFDNAEQQVSAKVRAALRLKLPTGLADAAFPAQQGEPRAIAGHLSRRSAGLEGPCDPSVPPAVLGRTCKPASKRGHFTTQLPAAMLEPTARSSKKKKSN